MSVVTQGSVGSTCASTGPAVPLDRGAAEDLADLLKAVADPTRLQLLALIAASPAGESCVCALTEPLGLTQPTVSHHLRILTRAGLLSREQRGTWAWYRLIPKRFAEVRAALPAP